MVKKDKRFWDVVKIAMVLPIVFAILDLIGAKMWSTAGGFGSSIYTMAEPLYMNLFWGFAYVVIISISLIYYLVRGDKSESLALLIVPIILLQFGAEDFFFYIIGGMNLATATLPWLTQVYGARLVSMIMGSAIVTGPSVILSTLIGYAIAYFTAKWLVKI